MTEHDLDRLAAAAVAPLLDLRDGQDVAAAWALAEKLRDRGCLAFILFGGEADVLPGRIRAFRAGAPGLSPLIAADLERGVAQQVQGASNQPPAMALGASGDADLVRRAGEALGREALALGIDWILGPVLDLADQPLNPIVGNRAFGDDPSQVGALGAAFVTGIQAAGVLACAKHYPGHGGTTADSHDALPVVSYSREQLRSRDLAPFEQVIEAGVATVMSAHVVYPGLSERAGLPATLNPDLVGTLLREELGFAGMLVSDAFIMEGAKGEGLAEEEALLRALEAGCDLLLFPRDPEAAIDAVAGWAGRSEENAARLRDAVDRVRAAAERRGAPGAAPAAGIEAELAGAAITRIGEARPALKDGESVGVLILDDDDTPELGHELVAGLSEAGLQVFPASVGVESHEGARLRWGAVAAEPQRLVAVVGCQVRAWKGRAGLHPELAELLRDLPGERTTVVALCGPAQLEGALPEGCELLLAYGDSPALQQAAARVLLGEAAPGKVPVSRP